MLAFICVLPSGRCRVARGSPASVLPLLWHTVAFQTGGPNELFLKLLLSVFGHNNEVVSLSHLL